MTALAEPGPELAGRNLRLLAEVGGWPDGTVEAIEKLEAEYGPAWGVSWSRGGLPWTPETGFYARPRGPGLSALAFYRATADEIAEVLKRAPDMSYGKWWSPPGGWLPRDGLLTG